MKRMIIFAFAVVALFVAATTTLQSHLLSTDRSVGSAGMVSLQELYTAADVNKLPSDEFEDMSLIYSTATKR